jgi:hypothetical protein
VIFFGFTSIFGLDGPVLIVNAFGLYFGFASTTTFGCFFTALFADFFGALALRDLDAETLERKDPAFGRKLFFFCTFGVTFFVDARTFVLAVFLTFDFLATVFAVVFFGTLFFCEDTFFAIEMVLAIIPQTNYIVYIVFHIKTVLKYIPW